MKFTRCDRCNSNVPDDEWYVEIDKAFNLVRHGENSPYLPYQAPHKVNDICQGCWRQIEKFIIYREAK